jgi:hypothetical protein
MSELGSEPTNGNTFVDESSAVFRMELPGTLGYQHHYVLATGAERRLV